MTRDEWDAIWQRVHDAARTAGASPNAAVHRADRFMEDNNHGERPNEETK